MAREDGDSYIDSPCLVLLIGLNPIKIVLLNSKRFHFRDKLVKLKAMIRTKIADYLKKVVRSDPRLYPRLSVSLVEVFAPENEKFGHYSTNIALKLAKLERKNPLIVAEKIVNLLNKTSRKNFFEKIEIAAPGFINFWLSQKTLAEELKQVIKADNDYGRSITGRGKTVVVDYSAPNIAKPMNVGHLRSTLIGQAIVNLLLFQGYRVIGDNHFGDWGTQFGTLLIAYKKWGKKREFEKNPVDYLTKLYVRFHKASEKNKELVALAREETRKLQSGYSENRQLWRLFVKKSLADFNKTYKRLGVKFDYVLGESFYQPMLAAVVAEALKKGIAKIEDDAVKIFYDNTLPPLVIQKSDGAHLYSTTDLATIKYRMKKWRPEKILYVVANEQTLHFEQIFNAALRLGYVKKDVLEHIKFGMVLGETGKKMSTRRGEFIKLEELLNKAVSKAGKINKKAAEIVGIASVKYRALSQERRSDIVFDWEQMLSLKGNSGPYVQYTYARLRSVLRKANGLPPKIDFLLLESESEKTVMRQIVYFADFLSRAANLRETNIIADYLLKLSNVLNGFYESEPILKAPRPLRENRLNLILAATTVLKNGLRLLGIEAPEKM